VVWICCPLSGKCKKDLCGFCVSSEAGGEKVIDIIRSNLTAQVETFRLSVLGGL
jgi:hypothetical protein